MSEDKYDCILWQAKQVASRVETWSDYSNVMFSQFGGILSREFKTSDERRAFYGSSQYRCVDDILGGLMAKTGAVEGANPKLPVPITSDAIFGLVVGRKPVKGEVIKWLGNRLVVSMDDAPRPLSGDAAGGEVGK